MAERGTRRRSPRGEAPSADEPELTATSPVSTVSDEDHERMLARLLARMVPSLGVIAALVVGKFEGLAPAVLVLAGTALLGTIGFLWASLRTLSGDAPLPEGALDHAPPPRVMAPERKRETLRALKDLELEHSIGKIDDADYEELQARYRQTAKALMREMDAGLAPRRQKAEALVVAHLAKKKLDREAKADEDDEDDDLPEAKAKPVAGEAARAAESPRVECGKCHVSNEPDAAFCKKCGNALGKAEPLAEEARDVPA